MEKLGLYVATICDSEFDKIFKGEGKEFGEYPVYAIPDPPSHKSESKLGLC
jgi:hypothetical protein